MVVTMLEAHLAEGRAADLIEAYRTGIADLEPEIVETLLMRDAGPGERWRIVTVWSSREALSAMRGAGGTPRGIQFFRAAGAEPVLTVSEVAERAVAG